MSLTWSEITWSPAKPNDTPGQVEPGEADVPQPVDLCTSSGHLWEFWLYEDPEDGVGIHCEREGCDGGWSMYEMLTVELDEETFESEQFGLITVASHWPATSGWPCLQHNAFQSLIVPVSIVDNGRWTSNPISGTEYHPDIVVEPRAPIRRMDTDVRVDQEGAR